MAFAYSDAPPMAKPPSTLHRSMAGHSDRQITPFGGDFARPYAPLLHRHTMSIASSINPTSPITHATPALARAAQPTEEISDNRTEARHSSDGCSHESGWSGWFDTGDDGQPQMVKNNHRYTKSSTSAVSIASSGVLSPSLMSWPSSRTDPISRDSQKYYSSGVIR